MSYEDIKKRTLWEDDSDRDNPRMFGGPSLEDVEGNRFDKIMRSKIPCLEFAAMTISLPVKSPHEVLGEEVNLFDNRAPRPPAASFEITPFTMNGIAQIDMLLVGYGVQVSVSPTRFVSSGMTPAGQHAILHYGAVDAAAHLLNSYKVMMTAMQRHIVFNDALHDVATIEVPTDDVAVDKTVPASPYVRRTNEACKNEGLPIFLSTQDLPAVDRRKPQLKPARSRLAKPVLIEKGIPLSMFMHVTNDVEQRQMYEAMSVVADTDPVVFYGGTLGIRLELYGFEVWGPWCDFFRKNHASLKDRVDYAAWHEWRPSTKLAK